MIRICRIAPVTVLAALLWTAASAVAQTLPPVPFPPQNPLTEPKRVLGKILFWDEQLSSDDTVACGTCHVPSSGGADPRGAVNPGPDGLFGSADDIQGSPGVVRRDASGEAIEDAVFGFEPQVTGRAAPSFLASLFAREMFWDGRASSAFTDPLDDSVVLIPNGGALESQSVKPILSSVEMAHDGRTWAEVTAKLESVRPLRYADSLPADALAAIAASPSYAQLFAAAFGDSAITPARIAMAIATYERTLAPGQTPWDRFVAGDTGAMTPSQVQGWNVFRGGAAACSRCHVPPMFTNNDFLNLGLRPAAEDEGRLTVSGLAEDFGDMKMPGLRNVGLRRTLMHTGGITGVPDAIDFYLQARGHRFFTADLDGIPPNNAPLGGIRIAPEDRPAIIDFLANALTDPRVAAETFPFDRPRLGSEAGAGVVRCANVALSDCKVARVPGRSPVRLVDAVGNDRDAIAWKLNGAESSDLADFGTPTTTDGAVLCLYEGEAADALIFEGRAPADGDCSDGACWRTIGAAASGKGFRYSSRTGSPDGVRKLNLKTGVDGKAKVSVTLAGASIATSAFGVPALPMALPLTVQLQSSSGACWTVEYAASTVNSAVAFTSR